MERLCDWFLVAFSIVVWALLVALVVTEAPWQVSTSVGVMAVLSIPVKKP